MSILTEIVTFRKRTNENEGRAAECLKCREEYQSNQRKELMLKKRNEAEAQLLMESVTIIQQTSQEIEDLFINILSIQTSDFKNSKISSQLSRQNH